MSKYDRSIITHPFYQPYRSILGIPEPNIGQSIAYETLDSPNLIRGFPFSNAGTMEVQIPPESRLRNQSFSYSFIEEEYAEAHTLSVWFRAAYGGDVASATGALNRVRTERKHSRSVYCNLLIEDAASEITKDPLKWREPPPSEKVVDDEEALDKFIATFGTHYVTAIRHGASFAARAQVSTTDRSVVNQIAIRLAAFGQSGGYNSSDQEQFRKYEVRVTAAIQAEIDGSGVPAVITDAEQLHVILTKIRTGEIVLKPIPISVRCDSYYRTLNDFPRTERLFRRQESQVPVAPFGVPAGTILPWCPPRRGNVDEIVRAPDGWAICDGRDSAYPNLTNLFLRGPSLDGEKLLYGQTDPTGVHSHSAYVGESNAGITHAGNGGDYASRPHGHDITVNSAVALPPWYSVVYIMRKPA